MSLPGIGATLTLLRAAFDLDTSELADLWDDDNPSTGHCHVAALLIREHHGGQIMVCDTWVPGEGTEQTMRPHYFNIVDGVTVDATRDQFPLDVELVLITDATAEVLNEKTKAKRDLLAERAFGGAA